MRRLSLCVAQGAVLLACILVQSECSLLECYDFSLSACLPAGTPRAELQHGLSHRMSAAVVKRAHHAPTDTLS